MVMQAAHLMARKHKEERGEEEKAGIPWSSLEAHLEQPEDFLPGPMFEKFHCLPVVPWCRQTKP